MAESELGTENILMLSLSKYEGVALALRQAQSEDVQQTNSPTRTNMNRDNLLASTTFSS